MKPYILGVDPGLTGCISVIDYTDFKPKIVALIDVPTYQTATKSRRSGFLKHLDIYKLHHDLKPFKRLVALAIVEEPGSMPGQGLSSTFRFGAVCGQIQGILAASDIAMQLVVPAVWKLALGLEKKKMAAIERVKLEFPESVGCFKRVKDHDRAESVLIATYGLKHHRKLIDLCAKS